MEEQDTLFFDKLNNDISIVTKVWGPAAWFFLHNMAMSYPKRINLDNPEHKEKYNSMYAFLSNLGNVLPCPVCSKSYNQYIKEPDLQIHQYLNSRKELFLFIYKIHEKVNDKLGVPKCDRVSFNEVINYYKKFIAGPCKETTNDERIQNMMNGCGSYDNDAKKFKNYKCSINVMDKDKNEMIQIHKEHFTMNGKDNGNGSNDGNGNGKDGNGKDGNGLAYTSIILNVIFIIAIIVLIMLLMRK